jgi:hypothetical protein
MRLGGAAQQIQHARKLRVPRPLSWFIAVARSGTMPAAVSGAHSLIGLPRRRPAAVSGFDQIAAVYEARRPASILRTTDRACDFSAVTKTAASSSADSEGVRGIQQFTV